MTPTLFSLDDPADFVHVDALRPFCAELHVEKLDPSRARLRSLAGFVKSMTQSFAETFVKWRMLPEPTAQIAQGGGQVAGFGQALLQGCEGLAVLLGERGHVDYAVSKAGMYGLVRTLKNEIVALDPYGRVNLVEPGWTAARPTAP